MSPHDILYHKIKKIHNNNGDTMSNIKRYNIFILLSTLARNVVEVFSSVLLYKMGYSLKEILLFFTILYLTGAITSIISIYLIKIIKPKYILILSSIIFSGSFYFMSIMNKTFINLIIFSIIYGIGSYTYHTLRHYYAIKSINNHERKEIGSILISTNIAMIISSIIGTYIEVKLSKFILAIIIIIISILAVIPIFKFDDTLDKDKIKIERMEKNKLLFFICEQAKVINLSLQPLYLYLFINNTISYVGIFNIIMGISSCIFIYFFVRKVDDKKYFKYLNIIFCLLLILKLNINNKYLMLIIALFEGLGIKIFEIVSAENIYSINKDTNIKGYILIVEIIFCSVRSILCLIGYFINNIKIILYFTIILIFMISFIKRKKK